MSAPGDPTPRSRAAPLPHQPPRHGRGISSTPSGADLPPTLRHLRTVAVGGAVAATAGALWYLAVVVTRREFFYVALAFGYLIGLATGWGATRRIRPSTYATAVVLTAVCILIATYFTDRYFLIRGLHQTGYTGHVDVWQGFGFASRLLLDKTFGGTRVFRGAARLHGDPLRLVTIALALAGSALGVLRARPRAA